ncbi:glycoside hydrolase family 88 protein [Thalassoroseus pseudoceratinae]|uniref:glycoside hydrolase family 88 protein n=1 Tax=Thalassoroseus pseudoceratinae TaxID=2713176 RepID=UPI00141DA89A|nr:glycoside hydrolase family 88 protein [Thalassoroseus pseudoceratinae]
MQIRLSLRFVVATLTLVFGLSHVSAFGQWEERPIGRDVQGNVLHAMVPESVEASRAKVLLIGGAKWLASQSSNSFPRSVDVFAIDFPLQGHEFPPKGTAYNKGDIAGLYLWRWIGSEGFDTVFVIGDGGEALKNALESHDVAKVGKVPCRLVATAGEVKTALQTNGVMVGKPDSAAVRIRQRKQRTPIEVATALSRHYGKQLRSIAYIPSLAVIGRQRLGEFTGNAELNKEAEAVIAPWLKRDHQPSGNKVPGGSTVAGYLVFADAYARTKEPRAKEIVLDIASIGLAKKSGQPVGFVPNHSEMSDSVFMDGPILATAGRLSGDTRYFEACLNHTRKMQELCLRDDGLYRHSPLDEAAWGRGNGFPALGLALVLSELPVDWSGRAEILQDFQNHIAALVKHQDATGMWHQVVDRPESYREFTSTCMITFAMLRGMRHGWLDPDKYREPANRGWDAIKSRIGSNGLDLTDVCTGTGKQKNLEAYFHRTAILGRDDRGGAMALMVSTERAFWERQNAR